MPLNRETGGGRHPDLRETDDLGLRARLLRQRGSGIQWEQPYEQTNALMAIPWHRLPPCSICCPAIASWDHLTAERYGITVLECRGQPDCDREFLALRRTGLAHSP